ncbi:MAG: hypothetical protein LBJ20_04350 [Candidatus Methanoplasma sp.]|jgi:hypothetical protein|nr:hypothetical protein [Candidatus Methanoplasma sp.]
MPSVKILDTCAAINIFEAIKSCDVAVRLEKYKVVMMEHVVSEYTRKMPRPIPACVSVFGFSQ